MKKANADAEDTQSDLERLQALTLPLPDGDELDYVCGYKLGYFLHVDNGMLLVEQHRGCRLTYSETHNFVRPESSRSDSGLFVRHESRARKPARGKT